jgi:insulysin
MLELFLKLVHPSSPTRSKLSVHMVSQKPRPKIVSAAAAEAFEVLVHEALPGVNEKAWRTSIEEENPSLIEFENYWVKVLNSEEGKKLLGQLPSLVDIYPVEGESDDRMASNTTYIEDVKAFKAGLTASVDPGHMVEWNDLPVSRF